MTRARLTPHVLRRLICLIIGHRWELDRIDFWNDEVVERCDRCGKERTREDFDGLE